MFVFGEKSQRLMMFLGILYLIIPYFIFYLGNLKNIYPLILSLGLTVILYFTGKEIQKIPFKKFALEKSTVFIILGIILALLLATGVGAVIGKQTGDWAKNNAVLHDLYEKSWPVSYNAVTSDGSNQVLNYYVAFYLPAALIGKVLGSYRACETTLLVWSFLGAGLGVFWMLVATGKPTLKTFLLFLFFAGMDVIGYVLTTGTWPDPLVHLDHWANITGRNGQHIANYHSMGTAWRWSIQHYICAWIATFETLTLLKKSNYKLLILFACLLLLWSPLVAIGLLPFAICLLLLEKFRIKKFISVPNILSLIVIAIPTSLYFLSMDLGTAGGAAAKIRGLTWLLNNWAILLLFITLEFGLLWSVVWKTGAIQSRIDQGLMLTAAVTMTIILLVDYGLCHDFSMRVSVIPWLVIFTYVPLALKTSKGNIKKALVTCLILGALSNMTEYADAINGVLFNPKSTQRALWIGNTLEGNTLQYQYTGKGDAFFFRELSRVRQNN